MVTFGANRGSNKAGMVDDPAHYRWSSYRANALGQAEPLVTPHGIYTALGSDEGPRSEHYRALFRTQIYNDPINDIRLALRSKPTAGRYSFCGHDRARDRAAARGEGARASEEG